MGGVELVTRHTGASSYSLRWTSTSEMRRSPRLWPLTDSIPWNSLSLTFAPGRLLPPFCILPWSLALLHPTFFRPHSFHIAYS